MRSSTALAPALVHRDVGGAHLGAAAVTSHSGSAPTVVSIVSSPPPPPPPVGADGALVWTCAGRVVVEEPFLRIARARVRVSGRTREVHRRDDAASFQCRPGAFASGISRQTQTLA